MTKSARTPAPESARLQHLERLTDAVNRLADETRVVRDVLDEICEDLVWVTRNGIPGRQGEQTRLDPLSADANERLEIRTSKLSPSSSTGLSETRFDELVNEITEAIAVVGKERVDLLLTSLDDARAKLLAAIKTPSVDPKPVMTAAASEQRVPTDKPSKPGQLF
ncbi:MAG: hypothetical protein FD138_1126 [Planctomycetota bacterium]|nr:MAG: hypothetical protein FD138_1126 [Planctomycetota bacterium]